MKKFLPILLMILVVLTCCVTAGCVSTNDPVIGSWVASDERDGQNVIITLTFTPDGMGTSAKVVDNEDPIIEKFDWIHTGSVYTFFFGDWTSSYVTIDAENKQLKSPSGLIFSRVTTN